MNRKLLCSFFAFILFLWGSPNLSYPQQGSLPDKAPSFIIEEINAGKSQDILVLLDDTAIESETSLMRRFYGVPYDNQNILEFKTFRYADIKQKVLKSLPEREFELIQDYSHLPVIFLKAKSPNMLSRLLSRNEVARVSEDQAHKHFLLESLPLINQPQVASSMIVGTGTTVAVLDTGVDYSLSSFGNCSLPGVPAGCKVVYASDFAPDDYRLDDNGHGTNVAGIVLGVAPDTRIAALDVFRSDGYAYSSDIISAINWCIANKDSYNIIAMNLSLGAGSYSEPCSGNIFETPVANARAAGILAAIASGNNGYIDSISSPACVPSSVSVGAVYDSNVGPRYWSTCSDETTAADKVTCFSNSASFLTLLAPGSVINAAGISMSGTSQATPHIAGSIAVLKGEGAFPEATPDETVARMTSTGISVTDWRNAIIKPRVDLLAALDSQNLPVANFTGTPTTGSAPLNVNFTDTSTGGPTTWAWNFGDGGTSNLQNPSHTYSTPGTYTVSLTVTNANGSDTETKTSYITVSPIQLPTISVTTPNGGERWTIYKSQAIRWTYSGNPGSTVRIELYKSGVLNRVITSGTSTNAGVYSWFIPYTQAVGSDYRIKITSTSNPSYSDMSNANFSITWGY
jgi:PKD repeat protein